jgi:hypothetical protein
MATLQNLQAEWDNLEPSDFENNYSRNLDETIYNPEIALKNLKKVLFEDESYIEDGVIWESLRCVSRSLDIENVIDDEFPISGMSVIQKTVMRREMEAFKKDHKEMLSRMSRHLITLKEAFYGSESINTFEVNNAIKNIEYMVYGYPIESKKLNIVRKG